MTSVAAVGAFTVLAACDTDDGRQLAEPEFGFPVTTPPTTVPVPTGAPTAPPSTGLTLLAPWQDGGEIPTRYTCDGDDLAPPLTWLDVPEGTVELALTMADLDSAGFVHWVLYGIPADRGGLVEGEVPEGASAWTNSFGDAGYGGPCPPAPESHRYVLTVHALNQAVDPADTSSAVDVINVLEQAAIASSSVTGVYPVPEGAVGP